MTHSNENCMDRLKFCKEVRSTIQTELNKPLPNPVKDIYKELLDDYNAEINDLKNQFL